MDTYEKKYKEAQKWIESIYSELSHEQQMEAEAFFPELAESEDEKIKKLLIEAVIQVLQDQYCSNRGVSKEKVVAWLEKQGEQKLADKVIKPKFHEGEWVVFNNRHDSVYQVEKIENYEYTLRHFLGGSMPLSFSHEDMIRAWTIQDARDGDVLTDDDYPCIFKSINEENVMFVYCGINGGGDFATKPESEDNIWSDYPECYFPATKDQRDTLFAKMKEAGYEWLEETKELKKIEQKSAEWSEEDEKMLNSFLHKVEVCNLLTNKEYAWIINKLKSLKPQNHWKPSIAQLNALSIVSKGNAPDDIEAIVSLYNDLKELT
jgi:hypothetical protein